MTEYRGEGSFNTHKVDVNPVSEALEAFPYALYVIGSRGADNVNGMMADWVMQVSFEPRLIACSLERNSTTLRNLRETGFFTVNVLHAEDEALARKFSQPRDATKIEGRSQAAASVVYDKLAGVPYQMGRESGCPVLDAALAYVECQVESFTEMGDHVLAVGRVLEGELLRDGDPLSSRSLGWSYAG